MSSYLPNQDITVRGGLINVPALTSPTQTPRHQPNTPTNKKNVKVRADHKPYVPEPDDDTPDAPPTEPLAADPPADPRAADPTD